MSDSKSTVDDKVIPTRRERVASDLAVLRSTVISTIIVLGILAAIVVTIRDLTRTPVVLEEIGVPEALQKEGYTGLVMSNMLWDQIEEIRTTTGTGKKTVRIQTASRQLDVVEPGSGLSLQRVTQILRSVFNFPQTRIAGEFICPQRACTPDELALTLRIFSGDGTRVIRSGPLGQQHMQDYMSHTALRLMELEIDPLTVAWYHYYTETEDWEAETIKLATQVMQRRGPDLERDPKAEEAVTVLGWMALYDLNPDRALVLSKDAEKVGDEIQHARSLPRKIAALFIDDGSAAIRADTLTLRAHALEHQAYALEGGNNYEGAREKYAGAQKLYAQAVDLAPEAATIRTDYARILGWLDDPQAALAQFQAAAARDPLNPYIYTDWADTLEDAENLDESARMREIALALAPKDAWVALAAKATTLDEELSYAKVSASEAPQDYDAWIHWSDLLWVKNETFDSNTCDGPVAEYVSSARTYAPDEALNDALFLAKEICGYVP